MKTNFTLPKKPISTCGANNGNAITKEYYDFLVGEINRDVIHKAVCRIEYPRFGDYCTYHLISL